jgi:anaerobic C4-dicarboxylate transporter DcuA/anaerobic C4-dicarboxylate transporter DcuB
LLPANGTQLASVAIDQTGTTRLTKNPLIHSFTIPLFVGWFVVVAAGLVFAGFI